MRLFGWTVRKLGGPIPALFYCCVTLLALSALLILMSAFA